MNLFYFFGIYFIPFFKHQNVSMHASECVYVHFPSYLSGIKHTSCVSLTNETFILDPISKCEILVQKERLPSGG